MYIQGLVCLPSRPDHRLHFPKESRLDSDDWMTDDAGVSRCI